MAYAPFTFNDFSAQMRQQNWDTLKLTTEKRIQIFEDRWDDILLFELRKHFSKEAFERMQHCATTEQNLLKRLINETAIIYKNPAQRKAVLNRTEGPEGVKETLDPNYEKMIDQGMLNSIMRSVNEYTDLLNQCLVRPVMRDGKMELDVIFLNNAEVYTHPDDWRRIVGVKVYVGHDLGTIPIYNDPGSASLKAQPDASAQPIGTTSTYKKAILFTLEDFREEYHDENDDFKLKANEYQRAMIYHFNKGSDTPAHSEQSPYKDEQLKPVLPFVLFWKKMPMTCLLDYSSGNDAVQATVNTALKHTHEDYLFKYQMFKKPVLKIPDASVVPGKVDIDPGTVLKIEVSTAGDNAGDYGLEAVDLQADIAPIHAFVLSRITTFLANYGVSPANFTLSGTPQSGYALKISNMGKMELREKQLPIYREREGVLFRIMRIVWNQHVPAGDRVKNEAKFVIDFGEYDFPLSPDEQTRLDTFNLLHNVSTPVDIIMRENPDLTKEEAMKKFMENKALNARASVTLQPLTLNGGKTSP